MFRKILALSAGLMGLALLSTGALASDAYGSNDDGYVRIWKPYVIEKTCSDARFYHCRARMDYAPFQRSMVVRPGSYWYQKPFQVYRYGDFQPSRVAFEHRRNADHVAWCSAHYRSYDPVSDQFMGKGYRLYRCNSPYDGR